MICVTKYIFRKTTLNLFYFFCRLFKFIFNIVRKAERKFSHLFANGNNFFLLHPVSESQSECECGKIAKEYK